MSSSNATYNQEVRQQLKQGCHAYVDGYRTPYDYVPGLAIGIVFCVLFGVAFLYHAFQALRKWRGTSILLGLGALTELIGWIGRTLSAKCPYDSTAFLMQITTLIIAPTFFSAALYVLLGQLIRILGRKSSAISATTYAIIFCTCDFISLVIQAVGGGLASIASDKVNGDTRPGTRIMVGGIVFQMIVMLLFTGFFIDFVRRARKIGIPSQYRLVLVAMIVAVTMIFIRSIYRTIELVQGWSGYLITHEVYFVVLDAAMMTVAVWVFVIFDPANMIPKDAAAAAPAIVAPSMSGSGSDLRETKNQQ